MHLSVFTLYTCMAFQTSITYILLLMTIYVTWNIQEQQYLVKSNLLACCLLKQCWPWVGVCVVYRASACKDNWVSTCTLHQFGNFCAIREFINFLPILRVKFVNTTVSISVGNLLFSAQFLKIFMHTLRTFGHFPNV